MTGRKSNLEKDTTISLENLTDEIRKISQMGKAINNSQLSRRAILVLMADMSKLPMRDIEIVLNNLPLLEKEYLK